MRRTPLLLRSVILVAAVSVSAYGEKTTPIGNAETPQQRRLAMIKSSLAEFEKLDTTQVVISNAEASDMTFYTRTDTGSTWQSWKLPAGQTIAFPAAKIIGLFTAQKRVTLPPIERSYLLEGGRKYIIYWNQNCWDLIRVEDQSRLGQDAR